MDRDVRLAGQELLLDAADEETLSADRRQRVDTIPVPPRRHLDNLNRRARLLETFFHHEGLNHCEAAPPCCQSNCSHLKFLLSGLQSDTVKFRESDAFFTHHQTRRAGEICPPDER